MRQLRNSRLFNIVILCSLIAFITITAVYAGAAPKETGPGDPAVKYAALLQAIRTVESNDNANPTGSNDNGKALGAYQIHFAYWQDAKMGGRYEKVRDTNYATRTVVQYWQRHCPAALESGDLRTLAMTHHGGPKGSNDTAYWTKIANAISAGKIAGNREGRADATTGVGKSIFQ